MLEGVLTQDTTRLRKALKWRELDCLNPTLSCRLQSNSPNAQALKEQLGQLLALPLAPKMSGRYLTGGAAAAVAHGAGLRAASGPAAPDSAQAAVPSETVDRVSQGFEPEEGHRARKVPLWREDMAGG